MACSCLWQLSMLQQHTFNWMLSVEVVDWLATPAIQATFAQQCVHRAVKCAQTRENSTPINALTINDTFNGGIITV